MAFEISKIEYIETGAIWRLAEDFNQEPAVLDGLENSRVSSVHMSWCIVLLDLYRQMAIVERPFLFDSQDHLQAQEVGVLLLPNSFHGSSVLVTLGMVP